MGVTYTSGPWLRRVVVTLGPLGQWKGRASGSAVRFEGDGTMNGLRLSCELHKVLMGTPQASSITVYNLSQDTRNAIRSGLTRVKVEAGWQNMGMHIVFKGNVFSVLSERSGPDIVTKISAAPGYGPLATSVSTRQFEGGWPVRTAVRMLAGDLGQDIMIDDADIQGVEGRLAEGGWYHSGSTKEGLDRLASEYGFSWNIDFDQFKAIGDKAVLGRTTELNGNGGALIGVTPVLSGPMQAMTGVKLKAVYVPDVRPGNTVRVNSVISPNCNGTYKVASCDISMDTHADAWTMDIDAKTIQ